MASTLASFSNYSSWLMCNVMPFEILYWFLTHSPKFEHLFT